MAFVSAAYFDPPIMVPMIVGVDCPPAIAHGNRGSEAAATQDSLDGLVDGWLALSTLRVRVGIFYLISPK
eukprot:6759026-Pyramimonas_sp.AAC.1